ncbi:MULTISPECIES: hypothetical protein [unclassified Rhodococcus (in: high G+C Gram-positive bacteria)]|jgi:hypothetical protein|uniref:hypothetical protein n=1 Tax=unclassified Rhodococcus (in: high G+C Gram-positive bacteria) TaxID=192944 RepID=UPI0004861238|nr:MULTISPECIES: hypothetical protein [unclassified Rhodococcus (in: high G+C Gram-positive bacteria)]KQU36211.1 hypothetical protein ASG69_18135 [Rhodococcus sp. Leaf225]KQU48759.1 hypothetical protein ASH03_02610 [Rhodococcus sp. Leaf258]MBY6676986.1 DUF2029 domain-containing protein [Rhodococcus sp. BP-332]
MSIFTSSMRMVGDLDSEFYDDERQRDVWNEAAAVGLQLHIFGGLIAAAVLPWVAGPTGAWIALGIIVFGAVVNYATIGYAKSKNVDLFAESRWFTARANVTAALMLVAFVGIGVTLAPDKYLPSRAGADTWAGLVVGGIVGGGAVALMIRRSRRRKQQFETEED